MQIKQLLFGGNKGYDWMVSFLGLMDTIRLKPKQQEPLNKDLAMTQYMLKMLTIMTNILVGNLIALQTQAQAGAIDVHTFVDSLVVCLTQPACKEIRTKLNDLDVAIPQSVSQDSVEKNALSYGCSLLKELAFKFLTYTQDEVSDLTLRRLLLSEFATIIKDHITSSQLYEQILARPSESSHLF